MDVGIVCGLTRKPPSFVESCPDFEEKKISEEEFKLNQRNSKAENRSTIFTIIAVILIAIKLFNHFVAQPRKEKERLAEKELFIQQIPEVYSNDSEYVEMRRRMNIEVNKEIVSIRFPNLKLEEIKSSVYINLDTFIKIGPKKKEFKVVNTMDDLELFSMITRNSEKYGILKVKDNNKIGLSQFKSFIKHCYGNIGVNNIKLEKSNSFFKYAIKNGAKKYKCMGKFIRIDKQNYIVYHESIEVGYDHTESNLESFSKKILKRSSKDINITAFEDLPVL